MRIQLIAEQDDQMTGLRRYTDTMMNYFRVQNIDATLTYTRAPVPPLLKLAGRATGKDFIRFLRHFPVRQKLGDADLYHFAAENLASALMFQRIKPSIVTVHGLLTYLLRDDPELRVYNHGIEARMDALSVKGLAKADVLIAVSKYLQDQLVNVIGIPAARIFVVPEAVDHNFFKQKEVTAAFKEKYNLRDDFRYILYVGSEQPRKNFPLLIRAFARVYQKYPDIRLLKVGQPEFQAQRDKALAVINELGIQDAVIFAGHAGADLVDFYNYCHIFVFPSRYEGFGFPPLEAMACGAAVICSNTTSLPEVVNDAALLHDPQDEDALVAHLETLLSDETLRQDYQRRGLENARQFDWNRTVQQTVEVYKRVLG